MVFLAQCVHYKFTGVMKYFTLKAEIRINHVMVCFMVVNDHTDQLTVYMYVCVFI